MIPSPTFNTKGLTELSIFTTIKPSNYKINLALLSHHLILDQNVLKVPNLPYPALVLDFLIADGTRMICAEVNFMYFK